MEEFDDVVLGARIEAARHLVAQEDFRLAGQFHRERQPPPLASRKDLHPLLGELLHPHFFQQLFHHSAPVFGIRSAHAQAKRKIHALANGEFFVGDAELRDIRDFAGEEIVHFEIPFFPKNLPLFLPVGDARHELQQRRFSTTRRTDDGAEVPQGKTSRYIRKEGAFPIRGGNGQGNIRNLKHDDKKLVMGIRKSGAKHFSGPCAIREVFHRPSLLPQF